MISSKYAVAEAGEQVFTRSWERIGGNLYRIHGNEAERVAEEQSKTIEQSNKAEVVAIEERLVQNGVELKKARRELKKQLKTENVTEEKAKSKKRMANLNVFGIRSGRYGGFFVRYKRRPIVPTPKGKIIW